MKPKRIIPLLPLSSSTPRCLASSSRALLFQSNYDFSLFLSPIFPSSLTRGRQTFSTSSFLFLDSPSLCYSLRNQRDREFGGSGWPKDRRVRCYIASVDKRKRGQKYTLDEARGSTIGKLANNTRLGQKNWHHLFIREFCGIWNTLF